MPRIQQNSAVKGSKKWIQKLVKVVACSMLYEPGVVIAIRNIHFFYIDVARDHDFKLETYEIVHLSRSCKKSL
jgi:hypothetical protein